MAGEMPLLGSMSWPGRHPGLSGGSDGGGVATDHPWVQRWSGYHMPLVRRRNSEEGTETQKDLRWAEWPATFVEHLGSAIC